MPQSKIRYDEQDADLVSGYKWRIDKYGYATTVKRISGKNKTIFMHRLIMNPPEGTDVDHVNRDRLDNRRANLRLATRSQNNVNSRLRSDNTSGIKGVSRCGQGWRAYINIRNKQLHLGVFKEKNTAILVRALKERQIYGNFSTR